MCWRQKIHIRIYKNFPSTKQARDNSIAQLVERQAKVIFDNPTQEISEDTQYDRAVGQRDANYDIHKTSDRYGKKKRKDAMDTVHNYVFG